MKNKFMERAIFLSKKSVQTNGGPFGAVVSFRGEIIGEGMNRVTIEKDCSLHAEVVAMREAQKKLNNFSLKGATLWSSTEPCPLCTSMVLWSRLDAVFYCNTRNDAKKIDFDDSDIFEELKKKPEDRRIPFRQMTEHHDEALEAFNLWDKKTDKVKY